MLQSRFNSFWGNHVKRLQLCLSPQRMKNLFFLSPSPFVMPDSYSQIHHTSTSHTLSSLLLPPLSVLSLIMESGIPFSLPSINIPTYSELCHKSEWWQSFMMSKNGPKWWNLHTKWKFSHLGRCRVSSSSQLFLVLNELHILLLYYEYTRAFSFLVSDHRKKRSH